MYLPNYLKYFTYISVMLLSSKLSVSVCVCVCVCLCVRVYVVYEDTNLYNNMGMTEVLQFEGGLWGHCLCPRNSKGLKNILNGVFLKI